MKGILKPVVISWPAGHAVAHADVEGGISQYVSLSKYRQLMTTERGSVSPRDDSP